MNARVSHGRSQWLRGVAILAVILIHVLAYLPKIYTLNAYHDFFIALDQLARFSVPLFIFLSGYGLTKKYHDAHTSPVPYLRSRVEKLIPLYVLWSLVSYWILNYVPAWTPAPENQKSLLYQLVLGQADYQLYFLPLIFQLYLLFPLLVWIQKKFPLGVLLLTLGVQLLFYIWYTGIIAQFPEVSKSWQTDRIQYVFALSWIGYFSLGIWLGLKERLSPHVISMLPYFAFAGLAYLVYTSIQAIENLVDPIIALKFTRWQVVLYTIPLCLAVVTFKNVASEHPSSQQLRSLLEWFGKESYLLFLAHTIALRIIFSGYRGEVSLSNLAVAILVWVMAIVISKWIASTKSFFPAVKAK